MDAGRVGRELRTQRHSPRVVFHALLVRLLSLPWLLQTLSPVSTAFSMTVCGTASLTTLSDACVRGFWTAVVPTALVGLVILASLPPIHALLSIAQKPFTDFLSLQEAEALNTGEEDVAEGDDEVHVPLWRTLILATISLVETLLWIGVGCYSLIVNPEDTWNGVRDFLVAATWFYATLRPVVWPTATAPSDLLSLFTAHLVLGIVTFFGHLYDRYVYSIPMPGTLRTVVYIINLVAVAGLLVLVLSMPLGIPSKRVNKEDIVSIPFVTFMSSRIGVSLCVPCKNIEITKEATVYGST